MEKNKTRLLRIFMGINILFIISLVVPFPWNPIFIIETFTIEYLLGDFLMFTTLIIFLIVLIVLYREIEFKFINFLLIWLVFVFSYQIFASIKIANDFDYEAISFTQGYNYFLSLWNDKIEILFDSDIDSIYASLMSFNKFGLLQFIILVLTLGMVNSKIPIVINSLLLFILVALLIFVFTKNYWKRSEYVRISTRSLKTFIIGQYTLNDIEAIDSNNRTFIIQYKKEKIMERQNFVERIKNSKEDIILLVKTKWCGECHMTNQVFKRVSESSDFEKIVFETLNADKFELWDVTEDFFNIKEVPTIIYFRDGKETDRIEGFTSEDKLIEFIKKNSKNKSSNKQQKTI